MCVLKLNRNTHIMRLKCTCTIDQERYSSQRISVLFKKRWLNAATHAIPIHGKFTIGTRLGQRENFTVHKIIHFPLCAFRFHLTVGSQRQETIHVTLYAPNWIVPLHCFPTRTAMWFLLSQAVIFSFHPLITQSLRLVLGSLLLQHIAAQEMRVCALALGSSSIARCHALPARVSSCVCSAAFFFATRFERKTSAKIEGAPLPQPWVFFQANRRIFSTGGPAALCGRLMNCARACDVIKYLPLD